MDADSEYLRMLNVDHQQLDTKWPMWREDGDILVTPDGYRWRIERAPTVADLLHVGDTVRTSYGTGGLVIKVSSWETCCCPHDRWGKVCVSSLLRPAILDYHRVVVTWSVVYVAGYAKRDKYGRFYDRGDYNYLNELVAVGDRILKLFENNRDEVLLITESPRATGPVQLGLF